MKTPGKPGVFYCNAKGIFGKNEKHNWEFTMNDESRLLATIWEAIDDFISSGDKQDVANVIVKSFVDSGYDLDLLYDAGDECPFLDRALSVIASADEEELDDDNYFSDDPQW